MLPFENQNIYWALAVCIVVYILIINYIRNLYDNFRKKIYIRESSEKYRQEQNRENLQVLWNRVDNFSEADRADLKKFVETNNQPISKGGYFSYDSLYSSNWVVFMEKRTPKEYTAIEAVSGKEMDKRMVLEEIDELTKEGHKVLSTRRTE